MSVTSRARAVTRTGVKVQRRIVIAQALFWPTMILTGAALGTAAVIVVRRRRALPHPDPVPVRPVDTAVG
ncbi:hypothetical protein H7J08_19890 [Mycobacterium frederiksbergense]|uniref:Uncharacterized protein n=1 Tax=Mycolicibacterium frederiksbergense TaxID=117567 RepID=A0A6H0S1G0_9MYCO|nr:hypothetical protein [Mycolicibacterium frederiksbergense]MCV7046911.1 hypothetical protein [Mycolicibacterium frederiksbergense]QIV80531.1 hypothetical protein EXE63_06205 [Mycolicibacterium frederiksbergense]